MSDLAEFLLARIAEDVQEVEAIDGGFDWDPRAREHGGADGLGLEWVNPTPEWSDSYRLAVPASRVLAECEAKRQIVELHQAEDRSGGWGAPADWRCRECGGRTAHPNLGWMPFARKWPCNTLRLLALPYADHPDYRDEWRPTPHDTPGMAWS